MRGARPLNPNEITRIRKTLIGRDLGLFEVLLNCGLRLTEALRLNLDDVVDVRGGVVNEVNIRPLKTGRGRRVPLNTRARSGIASIVDGRVDGPLFVSRNGSRLSRSQASRVFQKLRDDLELGHNVSSHSCRKAAATLMRRRGASLEVVRAVLGHQNLQSLQAYLGVDDDEVRDAVASLDDI